MQFIEENKKWFQRYNRPWGIAGGWAIDLFVGRNTRDHSDVEVAVLRSDQHALKTVLADWSFRKVVKGKFQEWEGEQLELPIHELHAVRRDTNAELEILLNEIIAEEWVFRRDPTITFPASSLFLKTKEGLPYLHPAIVLLYKAKGTRPKDTLDFQNAYPLLGEQDKKWLYDALQTHTPGHEWISRMEGEIK
ncbi:hypothetical protein NCCP2222_22200 [Sporosarcina sp. NCCP-2222]|uniref:nucleotidyltransferase domain-containing protein n=1 Tax=Sporosarcina sp. NCCP-2222 TaxID=2935073 RepID=UPI00207E4C21|nr:hypothetical protein [Sporosarcina sp. NCCP-2222]GKV56273.1 hypothetical protein NCCP2222_22200 [Sporosarcina sp. NCCP-2222]